ncbi:MAG: class I SAM-dependent methyltransferase [Deltaproteobacteria bacterium]|nr:class I SAM-dependent methyltransferase [Deltaproteobacteria bacterium]
MRDNRPSTTAEIVCFFRAADRYKPSERRVLDDAYAESFLSMPFRAALKSAAFAPAIIDRLELLAPGIGTYVLTRHRAIDDAVIQALPDVDQIVLLGAGYDSRAYRLPVGDRPIFEVDHPATSRRKAEIIERASRSRARSRAFRTDGREAATWPERDVRRVTVDFARESISERLRARGFDSTKPTFFVWEGVSMYLTRAAIVSTLSTIHALSAPRSSLAMDFWFLIDSPDATSTLHRMATGLVHLLGEPFTFALHPDDARAFMSRANFEVSQLTLAAELEVKYVPDSRKVYPTTYVIVAHPIGSPRVS